MKLSVLVLAYNHERFVAQAIESALSQRTTFDYEIVVGEDCSTDGTRAIVDALQKANPDKVRLLPPEPNKGAFGNFARTYKACSGELVAYLEADDYWTCDEKLQKQVDFLDRRPDVQTCCHPVQVLDESGKFISEFPSVTMTEWTLEEHLVESYIPSCAAVFRNRLFGEFPEWYGALETGDYAFHALNAQKGKIALLPDVMGVYRLHSGGTWSTTKPSVKNARILKGMRALNQHFGYRYDHILRKTMLSYQYRRAYELRAEGDLTGYRTELRRARLDVFKALWRHPVRYLFRDFSVLKLAARIFSPAPVHRWVYEARDAARAAKANA